MTSVPHPPSGDFSAGPRDPGIESGLIFVLIAVVLALMIPGVWWALVAAAYWVLVVLGTAAGATAVMVALAWSEDRRARAIHEATESRDRGR